MPRIKDTYDDAVIIGGRIKEKREEAGISQEALADKIGVTGNTIHRIEAGEVKTSVTKLCAIADALHTTPNDLCPERFEKKGSNASEQMANLFEQLPESCKDTAYATIMNMMKGMLGQPLDA